MALEPEVANALSDIASQYAESDMLLTPHPHDMNLIADHILAQSEATQRRIFASHYDRVIPAAKTLLNVQGSTEAGQLDMAQTRLVNAIKEAGVSTDMLLKETNSSIDNACKHTSYTIQHKTRDDWWRGGAGWCNGMASIPRQTT